MTEREIIGEEKAKMLDSLSKIESKEVCDKYVRDAIVNKFSMAYYAINGAFPSVENGDDHIDTTFDTFIKSLITITDGLRTMKKIYDFAKEHENEYPNLVNDLLDGKTNALEQIEMLEKAISDYTYFRKY